MKTIIVILLFISVTANAQIPKDKQLHFGAGAVIGAWGTLTTDDDRLKPIYGIGWATLAGAGKEILDLVTYGSPELRDLFVTILGAMIIVTVIIIVKSIVQNRKKKQYEKGF